MKLKHNIFKTIFYTQIRSFTTSRNTNFPAPGNKDSGEVNNPKSSNQPTTRELYNTLEQEKKNPRKILFLAVNVK